MRLLHTLAPEFHPEINPQPETEFRPKRKGILKCLSLRGGNSGAGARRGVLKHEIHPEFRPEIDHPLQMPKTHEIKVFFANSDHPTP